jgi:hypothetical protein
MIGTGIMLVLVLGEWPRKRSGMSDLHEANDQEQNDTAGWLLWVIGVAIIAVATMAAYKARDTTVAYAPVSQEVVAR